MQYKKYTITVLWATCRLSSQNNHWSKTDSDSSNSSLAQSMLDLDLQSSIPNNEEGEYGLLDSWNEISREIRKALVLRSINL